MKTLALIIGSVLYTSFAVSQTPKIIQNQLGFYKESQKIFSINESSKTEFSIVNYTDSIEVFKGITSISISDQFSGLSWSNADFSSLVTEGKYLLKINNEYSYPFIISENVYSDILKISIRSYFLNRASIDIESDFGSQYSREMGHPDSTVFIHESAASENRPAESTISSQGGWYDAGDYNKYIVNSSITVYTLLRTYEEHTVLFDTLNLNIPESNDSKADLINEIEYNINWMLTMQDPNDGGVYHKLTTKNFSPFIKPSLANEKRYVVQKSTSATLDFAATMAYYSRLIQDSIYSAEIFSKAQQAFSWAEKNPSKLYIQPNDITTGTYEDTNLEDEFFWAATELYLASDQNQQYLDYIKNVYISEIPSWQSVKTLGIISLANSETKFSKKCRKEIYYWANKLHKFASHQPLKQSLGVNGDGDYNWGSNSNIANHNLLLIQAYNLSRKKKYLATIQNNLNYLLGNNANGICFVTGFGSKSPLNPHHRPSATDGIKEPYPGFLVGGPNKDKQDADHVNYKYTKPALCYEDQEESYASNEIAINWTAPFIYSISFIVDRHN